MRTASALAGDKKNRGFTLLEVLVTLGLLMVIMAIAMPAIDSMIKFNQRLETKANMERLAKAIERTYRNHAFEIDGDPLPRIRFGGTTINNGPSVLPNFQAVITEGGEDASILEDGFNRPFRVFVSNRLTANIDGQPIPYHVIALVSNQGGAYNGPARSQTLDAGTTFNPATGQLTLAGYDTGVVINGLYVQQDIFRETKKKLQKLSDAWQNYYRLRYLQDPGRNINRDYFGEPVAGNARPLAWHPPQAGSVTANCGVADPDPAIWGYPLTSLNINVALGLGETDITDSWGNEIHALNCGTFGTTLRNPNTTVLGMNTPPYSALLGVRLPDGTDYLVSVIELH